MSVITGLVTWGNDIGSILQSWADMGIFKYALPFLLVFALVYGILWKSQLLGENKGVIVVIALAVGLLSLVNGYVPTFFENIFPYAGVGLAILLVVLILMGLFTSSKDNKAYTLVFYIIGAVIAFIVIISSLSSYNNYWAGGWFNQYWPSIIALLVIGGLIAAVIASTKKGA